MREKVSLSLQTSVQPSGTSVFRELSVTAEKIWRNSQKIFSAQNNTTYTVGFSLVRHLFKHPEHLFVENAERKSTKNCECEI